MRTASDFDRPPPGISQIDNLLYVDQGGFEPALENIYLAGIKVEMGILEGWNSKFAKGIKPNNNVGDILDTMVCPLPLLVLARKRSDLWRSRTRGCRSVDWRRLLYEVRNAAQPGGHENGVIAYLIHDVDIDTSSSCRISLLAHKIHSVPPVVLCFPTQAGNTEVFRRITAAGLVSALCKLYRELT